MHGLHNTSHQFAVPDGQLSCYDAPHLTVLDAVTGARLFSEYRTTIPPLTELALALPWKIVHATRAFLRPAVTRPRRDCINMPLMSGAWLSQYAETCGKQGDTL